MTGDAAHVLAVLRLIRTDRIGPTTYKGLIERFGSPEAALDALPSLSRGKTVAIPSEAEASKEREAWDRAGVWPLILGKDPYPSSLAAIEDAPPILLGRGDVNALKRRRIGMVGARNASMSGRKFARNLAAGLGAGGLCIVSGLARGIDTAAHDGALETGTVAVLAGGVDVIYPKENRDLYAAIQETGAVVSEMALGTEPVANLFPRRNRIISGLSEAVIVVEATERSGSLITARLAGEQGRDVLAVPGSPMDPRSAGPNRLIRDGAVLIRSADDVLEILGADVRSPDLFGQDSSDSSQGIEKIAEIDPDHLKSQVMDLLGLAPTSVDELIRQCQVSASSMAAAVLELELSGQVERHPGGRLARKG